MMIKVVGLLGHVGSCVIKKNVDIFPHLPHSPRMLVGSLRDYFFFDCLAGRCSWARPNVTGLLGQKLEAVSAVRDYTQLSGSRGLLTWDVMVVGCDGDAADGGGGDHDQDAGGDHDRCSPSSSARSRGSSFHGSSHSFHAPKPHTASFHGDEQALHSADPFVRALARNPATVRFRRKKIRASSARNSQYNSVGTAAAEYDEYDDLTSELTRALSARCTSTQQDEVVFCGKDFCTKNPDAVFDSSGPNDESDRFRLRKLGQSFGAGFGAGGRIMERISEVSTYASIVYSLHPYSYIHHRNLSSIK